MRLRLLTAITLLLLCAACSRGGETLAPLATDEAGVYLTALQTPLTPDEPSPTTLVATLTATLLNTPELPTPESVLPLLDIWSGQPTYIEESEPGLDFRVDYDILRWALVENESGYPALVHRKIPYCQIIPTAGRGLPRGWSITSSFETLGTILYEVTVVSQGDQVKFVNYYGRAGNIVTGFQVSFEEQDTACRQGAEKIFSTLRAATAVTPTPSPTSSP